MVYVPARYGRNGIVENMDLDGLHAHPQSSPVTLYMWHALLSQLTDLFYIDWKEGFDFHYVETNRFLLYCDKSFGQLSLFFTLTIPKLYKIGALHIFINSKFYKN